MKSMRKKVELPEVEPVSLRPLWGIRPGVFILAGIALAVIVISFLLFVLPGLLSDSDYIRFETNTVNTAIHTDDGKYIGSSEGSVYRLKSGDYTFVFSIDGEEAGRVDVEVPKRIFFTLFTHKTDTVSFTVENTERIENAVKNTFAGDVVSWSRVIDYDDAYHFPPLFSSFAENAVALGFEDISSLLLYGALHITSEVMYRDYLSALSILEGSSVAYRSPVLDDLNTNLEEIYTSGSFRNLNSANPEIEGMQEEDGFFTYPGYTVEMGKASELSYPAVNESPITVSADSFSIAPRLVTEYEYALFVEGNPYWSSENKEQLIADGMVDEGYLSGIALSSSIMSSRPIRNISYYAAEAYCNWLSSISGESYHLPSEAEWYIAALSASDKPYTTSLLHFDFDTTSPSMMMGGLWEMTETPYIPLMRVSDYNEAIALSSVYPYDGIIVKGGSYINTPAEVSIESVGVVDKNSTSQFVGFRVCR